MLGAIIGDIVGSVYENTEMKSKCPKPGPQRILSSR